MKILSISQVYWPDTASTAQHLTDLLEGLVKDGNEVTVITSKNNYENPEISYSKRDENKGVEIIRLSNTSYGKKTIIGRLSDFISFNFLIFFKLGFLRVKSYDIIIGMTSPPLLSFIGVFFAKIKKIKFVYWTMDLQPELSIVAGYMKENSLSAKILQKMGDYIFNKSSKIITLDSYMTQHIKNRLKHKTDISEVAVWPVMSEIYKGDRLENPFRIENNFGDKIVVMYSGNHSVMHPVDTLIHAAIELKDDKRFLFVHIGSGIRLKDVKYNKEKYNLENVVILPYQPRELIHLSLGSSDIQVVTLGNDCVGYTHPNKIYGAMFIGKPILYIGPDKSHITDILDKCIGNISIKHNDVDKLVIELKKFATNGISKSYIVGDNNKNYANKYFSPEVLKNKMINNITN